MNGVDWKLPVAGLSVLLQSGALDPVTLAEARTLSEQRLSAEAIIRGEA